MTGPTVEQLVEQVRKSMTCPRFGDAYWHRRPCRWCDELEVAVAALSALQARVEAAERERDERMQSIKTIVKENGVVVTRQRKALRIYEAAYDAVLAHAKELRMDTPEDERVRLKLVALLEDVLVLAALADTPKEGNES